MDALLTPATDALAAAPPLPHSPTLALALGQSMMAMLTAKHSPAAATAFARSVTIPTVPGTPERAMQDRVWGLLSARLEKLGLEGVS